MDGPGNFSVSKHEEQSQLNFKKRYSKDKQAGVASTVRKWPKGRGQKINHWKCLTISKIVDNSWKSRLDADLWVEVNHEPGTREGNANSGKMGWRLYLEDFSGGAAVKTAPSSTGIWVQSLIWELRSCVPHSQKKKKKKKNTEHKTEGIL